MGVLCRVEEQAGQLGVLEGIGGAFQLWAELGSLVHLSLLLSLQLPLPLTELMENEALEILTEALGSEPPHPLHPPHTSPPPPTSRRDPGGLCRPWYYMSGVSGCVCLSDSLTTHKYSRSFTKSKKPEYGVTVTGLGCSLSAAPLNLLWLF